MVPLLAETPQICMIAMSCNYHHCHTCSAICCCDCTLQATAASQTACKYRSRGQGKAQSPAVQEQQRAFQSLEASLSSQLDPIDWATYEPYLWANEATYYQRAATLFGALLQTQRLHTQVLPSKHCPAADQAWQTVLGLCASTA